MYVCMYVCMYACIDVLLLSGLYAHSVRRWRADDKKLLDSVCMASCIHTHGGMHTHIHTIFIGVMHTHIHTHIHPFWRCGFLGIFVNMECMPASASEARIFIYTHTHIPCLLASCIHTYINGAMHTHVHTYTHTYLLEVRVSWHLGKHGMHAHISLRSTYFHLVHTYIKHIHTHKHTFWRWGLLGILVNMECIRASASKARIFILSIVIKGPS
jgi:hypothetical protein